MPHSDCNLTKWYLARDGKSYGPYQEDQIVDMLENDLLFENDRLWRKGYSNWVLLSESKFSPSFEEFGEFDPAEALAKSLEEEYKSKPRSSFQRVGGGPKSSSEPVKSLSDWLGVDPNDLSEIGENANDLYDPFPIQGRRKKRWIEAPSDQLKAIQRSILDILLQPIPLSGAAHGFVPHRSILTHASHHRKKRWVVTLDIRAFFPSVNDDMVRAIARELPIPSEDVDLFVSLTTRNNHLPQGAPTSPTLGNLVLRNLDNELCEVVRGTGWFYTRYADDLTFSGFGNPKLMLLTAKRLIEKSGFSVSQEKCRIRGKNQRQMVTGIVVNNKLALTREKRNMVRAMKHRLRNGMVPPEEMPHVIGWINFYNYVEDCNLSMPRHGSSVRPRRISILKILRAGAMVMEGISPEWIAYKHSISISSVRRSGEKEYIYRKIALASRSELKKLDPNERLYGGLCIMHVLAKAGRLFELDLSNLQSSDLLRLDFRGKTVLGHAHRAAGGISSDLHPLLVDHEELLVTSNHLEKIADLVLKEQEREALDLALNISCPLVYGSLLKVEGDDFGFPDWLYAPSRHDYRGFFISLMNALGHLPLQGFQSPFSKYEFLDCSNSDILNLDFLWGCNDLKELKLDYCEGLQDLQGLQNCPNLTSLSLDGCDAIDDFSPLEKLSNLKNLSMKTSLSPTGSLEGEDACRTAWGKLKIDIGEFDDESFLYTGTIASGEPDLIFSDRKFQVSAEQMRLLENAKDSWSFDYHADWFAPIKEFVEENCEKWGPSLCVKINGRWAIMGLYPD